MDQSQVVGEKIILRPLKRGDMPLFTKWHNDREIMRFIALTRETSKEYWLDWFEKISANPTAVYFGITKKNDRRLIGYIHLEQIIQEHRLCKDIGIVIGEKEEWSKGYGTEAMHLLINYAFQELRLYRLELMTLDFNVRGLRVWHKCAFKQEGVMRKARLIEGEWHDVIFMALLKDEYSFLQ